MFHSHENERIPNRIIIYVHGLHVEKRSSRAFPGLMQAIRLIN